MTNKEMIALYQAQILDIENKAAKRKAQFETGSYKSCKKYPAYMHEEMNQRFVDADNSSIAQLKKLIGDLC